MSTPDSISTPSLEELARWSAQEVREALSNLGSVGESLRDSLRASEQRNAQLQHDVESLKQQLEWFRRQIFGPKSEKRLVEPDPTQLHLGQFLPVPEQAPVPLEHTVPAHKRRAARSDFSDSAKDESNLFFDESRVPVKVIEVANPEIAGLTAEQYEVIGEKVSHRLAQQPGSYVVLKYVRPVIKRKDTQALSCPPAPQGVIEGSRADVSLIAGMLIDKMQWHLPLYRQHQRMLQAGVRVSRGWLTQVSAQAIGLLEPIYEAQLASIRSSRIKAMDETPIKAGRAGPGKLKSCYFWPVYGEHDEVCFPFAQTRAHATVETILGVEPVPDGVLLSDGYGAYAAYAAKTGLKHAQCWAHCRREFFNAQAAEPVLANEALDRIRAIYKVEEDSRARKLSGEHRHLHRFEHAKPLVEGFFKWVCERLEDKALLPTNRFVQALGYAHAHRQALSVFLADPDVPLDTNHLERSLRPIPLGRKNWLFSWTELGARQIGIVQSLIVTCQLHDINAYDYLVDVLQRVDRHPASSVALLTPRLWKQHFADQRLRSTVESLLA
jgi:transposase